MQKHLRLDVSIVCSLYETKQRVFWTHPRVGELSFVDTHQNEHIGVAGRSDGKFVIVF